MEGRKIIRDKLFNDLLIVESDLTRLTKRQHKKCMKHVNKLIKLVERYYK